MVKGFLACLDKFYLHVRISISFKMNALMSYLNLHWSYIG